ncbi:MAG: hypothetical protein MZV64_69370 [Ignavibacteriales bacterium]|nr:hypothetical protein [Ignavibacteriales bacterium]
MKIKMLEEGEPPANFVVIGSGLAVGSEKDWKLQTSILVMVPIFYGMKTILVLLLQFFMREGI